MLIDAEHDDILAPGLVGREPPQLRLDSPLHRFPRRAELTGQALHGGVLGAQLRDRPADGPRGDRPAPGDQTRKLLHERPPRASHLVAPPDPLPPHCPHPRRRGARDEGPVGGVRGRSRRPHTRDSRSAPRVSRPSPPATRHDDRRARHGPCPGRAAVAAGTRISGRARVSAPRSRVKHVEVLVKIRELALLILGDLDPCPPTITRRALTPPNVRRAEYPIEFRDGVDGFAQ